VTSWPSYLTALWRVDRTFWHSIRCIQELRRRRWLRDCTRCNDLPCCTCNVHRPVSFKFPRPQITDVTNHSCHDTVTLNPNNQTELHGVAVALLCDELTVWWDVCVWRVDWWRHDRVTSWLVAMSSSIAYSGAQTWRPPLHPLCLRTWRPPPPFVWGYGSRANPFVGRPGGRPTSPLSWPSWVPAPFVIWGSDWGPRGCPYSLCLGSGGCP